MDGHDIHVSQRMKPPHFGIPDSSATRIFLFLMISMKIVLD